ncbi:MAG: SDR family NAD(P)-dependent oxidoreductase [Acidimicrobiia bacterium]|nr:SDR family NAD(P)-dependent oxidoreductase [Acidimicrobiia bacterium]
MLAPDARVVMVSGATGGIGRALAERLRADGFRLSLGARRPEQLDDLVASWAAAGPTGTGTGTGVLCHRFDAHDPASAEAWVAATAEQFGGIDALVNNAGVLAPFAVDAFDEESLDTMWAVNVKAPARLTALAWPHLCRSGHGRVVNLASLSAKRVRNGFAPGYAMTKHALLALTHATRQAGWDQGVRAVALCPSFVDTTMIAGVDPGPEPIVQPSDVADLVSMALCLPDHLSVPEIVVNCRREDLF